MKMKNVTLTYTLYPLNSEFVNSLTTEQKEKLETILSYLPYLQAELQDNCEWQVKDEIERLKEDSESERASIPFSGLLKMMGGDLFSGNWGITVPKEFKTKAVKILKWILAQPPAGHYCFIDSPISIQIDREGNYYTEYDDSDILPTISKRVTTFTDKDVTDVLTTIQGYFSKIASQINSIWGNYIDWDWLYSRELTIAKGQNNALYLWYDNDETEGEIGELLMYLN
jgi:hypothetical protein